MQDDDLFKNNKDFSDNEIDKENTFFNLLSNEKSLKNIFIISELLNIKKFENE